MKILIISTLLAGMLATNDVAQNADILKKTARDAYDAISKHDLTKFAGYFADDVVDYGQGPIPVKGKRPW